MSKNKYLYKRHNTWWVKLSVPKALRDKLGYDLRQTTGTSNLDEAILKRDQIVQEFRDVINTEKNLLEKDAQQILRKGKEYLLYMLLYLGSKSNHLCPSGLKKCRLMHLTAIYLI